MNIWTSSSIRLGDCRTAFLSRIATVALARIFIRMHVSNLVQYWLLQRSHWQRNSRSISSRCYHLSWSLGGHEVSLRSLRIRLDRVPTRLEVQTNLAIVRYRERIFLISTYSKIRYPGFGYLVYAVQAICTVIVKYSRKINEHTLTFFWCFHLRFRNAKASTVLDMKSHLMMNMGHDFGRLWIVSVFLTASLLCR